MLLEQLKIRLRAEYNALRLSLITSQLSASAILDRAYEIVWKEEIVCLFEGMPETNRYTEDILLGIMNESNSLNLLYDIWMRTDYLLSTEFSNLLYDELFYKKGWYK